MQLIFFSQWEMNRKSFQNSDPKTTIESPLKKETKKIEIQARLNICVIDLLFLNSQRAQKLKTNQD